MDCKSVYGKEVWKVILLERMGNRVLEMGIFELGVGLGVERKA